MFPRRLLNLMILNWSFCWSSDSRLRTGRRSTWEPGKNALTPMSTDRPPFTRETIVPSTGSSAS